MHRSLAVVSLAVVLSACHSSRTDCSEGARKDDVLRAVESYYLYLDLLPATIDPSSVATADDLLAALTATAREQGKDRGWSFLMPEAAYRQYFTEGQTIGYGLSLLTTGAAPSLRVFVKQVFEGSAAAEAGFQRGDEIVAAGPAAPLTEVAGLDADTVSALLSAGGVTGVSKTLAVLPVGGGAEVERTMVSAAYDLSPVASVKVFGTTGYVQLRTFISSADQPLRDAFTTFANAGVKNVVVDLRYNGGGSVDTARLLAELLARGLDGKDLVELRFNGNHPDDTASGQFAFHAQPESGTFQNVAFITTSASASASELVPNVLDAYPGSLEVGYVGTATYGKPVGQIVLGPSGCDSVLFLIAFRLVNASGNVDYFEGLPDAASNGPLCDAEDDLTHPQDSADEASTQTAVYFAEHGSCPPPPPPALRARAQAASIDQLAGAARTVVQRDMPGTF